MSGFANGLDKGGAVDNKGGTAHEDGQPDRRSSPRRPHYTIPLRTPFALTGKASDPGRRRARSTAGSRTTAAAAKGTTLLNNTKTNGPLFAMFGTSGQISAERHAPVQLAEREPPDARPTRVFPEMRKILENNTNADTGACTGRADRAAGAAFAIEGVLHGVPADVGLRRRRRGRNASPLSLNFRFTARDGKGGENSDDTTLLARGRHGPFRVTSPNDSVGGGPADADGDVGRRGHGRRGDRRRRT